MNSINENGCSVCQPGKENYTTYTTKLGRKRVRMYQYDYRTESGGLSLYNDINNCNTMCYLCFKNDK